jgi:glycosyl transferase family 25
MKIFVINLDREQQRLARIERVFAGLGLDFTMVSAIDRETLPADELHKWQSREAGVRHLRPGETACFLSHRECWRRIVREDLPLAAVFEDDIHIGTDATAVLRSADWFPAEADIVKIETKLEYARVDKSSVGDVGQRTMHRMRSKHAGAAGYILTRDCAEKLLGMSEIMSSPVDQFMFNTALPSSASLALFQLLPAVCVQDFYIKTPATTIGLGSDLHNERTSPATEGLAKLLRRVVRLAGKVTQRGARLASSAVSQKKWVFVRFI